MSICTFGTTKTEGFETKSTGNNYQSTVTISTTESDCGISWQIYYGCVSTSSKISGSNSAALRLYTTNNYGYIKTTTAIDNLTNVTFKAKAATSNSALIKVNISYSANGSTWTNIETNKSLTTSSKTYSVDIPSGGKYFQIAISSSSTKPSTKNAQLTIDDVVFTYGTPTYTVSYNSNGGSGIMTDSNSPYTAGSTVTTLTNTFTRTNYTFAGWNTSSDGNGTSYDEGDQFTINANTTLYAQWEEEGPHITKYNITYNPNGGTGTLVDPNSPYDSGSSVTILYNTFTREHNTFNGWNTAADGTGTDYVEGQTFTITKSVVLYAQWTLSEEANGFSFELLTDINDLIDGDSIIIVSSDNSSALSVTQNNNNRGVSTAFNFTDGIITLLDNSVQILETHKADDLWELYDGVGYLYAASSTSNHLKTQNVNNANGQWDISIDENTHEASIVAQGTNTHNILRYNSTNNLFSCYLNGMQAVKIYKLKQCNQEYSIVFKNNGSVYDIKHIPSCTKHLPSLPINPTNTLSCSNSAVFVGWTETELFSTNNGVPTDLFNRIKKAPEIDGDKIFHAVFADEELLSPKDAEFTLVIDEHDFTSTSYLVNNTTKITVAETENGDTLHISWTSYQVYKNNGMQWQKGNGNIYNNTPLGTINSITITSSEGEFTTYYGNSQNPESNTNVGGSYFNIYVGDDAGGRTSKITIRFTKNITPRQYSNYVTTCTDTLKSGNNWSNGTWSLNRMPKINERAVINTNVIVDIDTAKAKEVFLNNSSIEIPAGKMLVIQDSLRKGNNLPTEHNNINIGSTLGDGLGVLVIGKDDGTNKATVNFATLSHGITDDPSSVNQYLGTPFNDERNILHNWYNSWIYRVNYNQTPISWERVTEGNGMNPFEGYTIISADGENHVYWQQGTLVDTKEKLITGLSNRDNTGASNPNNENLLANSWIAPIRIGSFTTGDFKNTEATIYIFNSGSPNDYDGTTGSGAAQYSVYPIELANNTVIPPMQAFSVYTTSENASLRLNYNRLVYEPTLTNSEDHTGPSINRAPKSNEILTKLSITVQGQNGYKDYVEIIENEESTELFDNGWDGKKVFGENIAPQIYTITNDGEMSVDCRKDIEGTIIGFTKSTQDNFYTISFDYNGNNILYLNDLLNETSILINRDNKYIFNSFNDDHEARFIISSLPINKNSTGCQETSQTHKYVYKFLYETQMYIIRNSKIYNTNGVQIK